MLIGYQILMRLNPHGIPNVLEGYLDANRILDPDETKSTSGFTITLGGGAVAWKSSKHIAHSTMESKLTTLDLAGSDAKWLIF